MTMRRTWCALFLLPCCALTQAQQPTVYVSVVATKLFVVGAANPRTGIFFQRPSDDTTWQHTGAVNIRAFGVAVPAAGRGRTLLIASGNGVHRSTDGGASWKITTDWRITEVLWVAPDPRSDDTVYCATPYGVFKSTDACASWNEMNAGLAGLFTTCVQPDIGVQGRVWCATEDGLYCSDDGARHWRKSSLSVPGVRTVAQNPRDPSVLLAGTESYGIYVSRNGGRTWDRSESGIDHPTFYAVAFDPMHPDTVYAGGYVTGVYKSTDGARSWKRINNGIAVPTIHSLAVDPTNPSRVYAASLWGGVYRTDDGGLAWRSAGLTGSEIWQVIIQPF
jgi:photosystem II stability/assembly factor-like uncharacterized protein